MKYYKIITDRKALEDFIKWLPDLQDNEKFYLSLFARKKYCPELIKSNDKTQLKRFTSNKERLIEKIEQLELPLGKWKLRGMEAPQESLVLYIMPNPRCMVRATHDMGKKCWDLIKNKNYNLHAEAMSCIQRAKSRSCFVHFDIDWKTELVNFVNPLYDILPRDTFSVLQTRGGFHLLVDSKKAKTKIELHNSHFRLSGQYNPNWYLELQKKFQDKIDQSGDQMMPVPGCIQGGFTPNFCSL